LSLHTNCLTDAGIVALRASGDGGDIGTSRIRRNCRKEPAAVNNII